MTVKELKKKLKGQYTDIVVFNVNHKRAIPFTQLGPRFNGLYGKAFTKELDKSEVVEYELSESYTGFKASFDEVVQGTEWTRYKARDLTIYIE